MNLNQTKKEVSPCLCQLYVLIIFSFTIISLTHSTFTTHFLVFMFCCCFCFYNFSIFILIHFWICISSRKEQILWNILYCNIIITLLNVFLCVLSYVTWNTNALYSRITRNQIRVFFLLNFWLFFFHLVLCYLPEFVLVIFAMLLLLDVCLSIYII